MHSAEVASDFGTIDPLDIQRPLPEMWCSMPQTSLQPEVPHVENAFLFNNAVAGNYGSAHPEGVLDPARSFNPSGPYSLDPLVPKAREEVRAFPCLFIQHKSGHMATAQGPGHLEFVYSQAQLDRWIDFARARGVSLQVARSPNGGEGPQIGRDAPPATRSSISGWHPGQPSLLQPTPTGPQIPIATTPMSAQVHPSRQFGQYPVPRSSFSGPSDSRCAPAATSIPTAPHHYDAPPSLNHPPPLISYTANLDPRRSAHPQAFYQSSVPMDDRAPICFESPAHPPADNRTPPVSMPQLISPTQGTGIAPEYPVHGDPTLEAQAQSHRKIGGHGRMHGPHGRGRSG